MKKAVLIAIAVALVLCGLLLWKWIRRPKEEATPLLPTTHLSAAVEEDAPAKPEVAIPDNIPMFTRVAELLE